jgi:uncharacterized repeat protein (TIGR01451 family)
MFDSSTLSFSNVMTPMQSARRQPLLHLLADGKVQIIGGDTRHTMEVFDPADAQFKGLAQLPPAPHLLESTLHTPARAALIGAGIAAADPQYHALLDRSGYTMTRIGGTNQVLIAGGSNHKGTLRSAMLLTESAASITTGKTDYAPGETVTIDGEGWKPGERVRILVHRQPEAAAVRPLEAIADANGRIVNRQFAPVQADLGKNFVITAKGESSEQTAQSSFADAAVLTITLGSQETFWIDANKCSAQGPRAAWLSYIIKNTGDAPANNVVVTFAGFTGTPGGLVQPSYFSAPADLTRTFSTIPAGAQQPAYFYVDYSEVCAHPQGGGNSYTGFTAGYTVTASATGLSNVVYNGTVTTNELLNANAAGQAQSTTISAGFWVGQILNQTVAYAFGNNTDLFFQPAGEAGFDSACIRLVGSEITSVTGNVSQSLVGLKDQLWFPTASVAGGGGNINVTFTWLIVCTNRSQTLNPWAAAKSGNKYKYTGFNAAAGTVYPPSNDALTVTKTVSPTSRPDNTGGPITWTVTFSNSATVPVILSSIKDTLPACMTINEATSTGSQVTSGNSSSIPSVGASGLVSWNGIDLGDDPATTYAVPANGTWTLVYKTNISGCPNTSGSYTNSVTGTVGTKTVGPTTATFSIGANADLQVTKTDGATTYSPGTNVVYTVVFTNAGPGPVTGATISDPLPSGISSSSWTAVAAGGATGFSASGNGAINQVVNMPSGSSITFTVTMAVPAGRTGDLVNTATITAPAGVTDPTPGNNSATDTDTQSSNADLSVTKTDGVTTYLAGGSVTYTIIVTNAGPSNVTGATVSDPLPAGITTTSWTSTTTGGATATASGSGAISDTVNMPAGSTITYVVVTSIPGGKSGDLVNTVTVTPPNGVSDPTPGNNSATDTDTQVTADLSVTKTDGVTTYSAGGTVTYTIVVSNAGPNTVLGASVSDPVPAGVTTTWTAVATGGAMGFSSSGSGAINDSVNMPSGSTITYTVIATIAGNKTGNLVNTVTVTPPSGVLDPTPGNNSATDTDTPTPADLSITKTDGVTTYIAGGTTTYTITASNAGPNAAIGATISDPLPSGVTAMTWTSVAAGGATGNTASGSGAISETVSMPAGSSITYTVVATIAANKTGNLVNTATVTAPATVTDPTPGNNSATDTDTQASADLSVTKTDNTTTYTAGGTTTYTIVVLNAGPNAVTGATISDPLPSGVTGMTWTSVAAGGATGNTASSSGAISETVNLPVGSSITYTVVATIAASKSDSLTNTVTVNPPAGVNDPTPGNNSATDTDGQSAADLAITKTDGVTTYIAGGTTTYTITVSNAGPNAVIGATISDPLPAGVTAMTWTSVAAGGATGNTASSSGAISETVNLPVGSSITYTVVATIAANKTGNLVNTATVSTPSGVSDPTPGNNSATDTDTQASADLSVTKTDNTTTYTAGGTTTYTIVVSNAGPNAVTGATISDPLPTGITTMTWTSVAAGGATGNTASGSGAISQTVNMPVGSSITYTVVAAIPANKTGNLVNTVTVNPPAGVNDPTPGNNTATDTDTQFIPPQADLTVVKTDNSLTYTPGSNLSYTITVTNLGPDANAGYSVTDTLPAGTTFVSAPGCTNNNGTITCTGAGLAANAQATYTITVTPSAALTTCLINSATVTTTSTADPNPANNSSSDLDAAFLTTPQSNGLRLSLGYPLITGNNTSPNATAYNTAQQLFSMNSTPATARFTGADTNHPFSGAPGVQVGGTVNNTGVLTAGIAGNDLQVSGTVTDENGNTFTGVLLTGEAFQFGFRDLGQTDRFEVRFLVTGGLLANRFAGRDIGLVITAENSTFNGSFAVNFGSTGKFTLGSLPGICSIN